MNLSKYYKLYPKEIWILTFISFIFVARKTIFVVSRQVGDYTATVDSSTSLALIGLFAGLVAIIYYNSCVKKFKNKVFIYTAYYILAICSILWAGNASIILFKAVEVLICFYLICLTIYRINNINKAIFYTIFFSTAVSATDFLNTIIKLGTNALHTNAYTMSAMIALLLSLTCIKLNIFSFKSLKYIIILNGIMIIMGTSGASYISTIIGLLFLLATNKKGVSIIGVTLFSLILYYIYDAFSEDIIHLLFPGRSIESIESGTGRSKIWEACFRSWEQSPILGKGFIVGERSLSNFGLGHNALSAHNSFMSVLVNTGLIGIFFFLFFLIKWFWKVYTLGKKNTYANALFPAMVAAIVNCNSCPALGTDWGYVASCMYCLIAISFIYLPRKNYH